MDSRAFCCLILAVAIATVVKGDAEKFSLDIEEQGWQLTEEMEVDVEANTERIVVPQHNDVAGTTFLHDFNLNVSLRVLAGSGDCYLVDLSEQLDQGHAISPRTLRDNMKMAEEDEGRARMRRAAGSDEEEDGPPVEDVEQSWAYGGELDEVERQALSPAMQAECRGRPIKWLFRVHDHVHAHSAGRGGPQPSAGRSASALFNALRQRHRDRRAIIHENPAQEGGDQELFTPGCRAVNLANRCKKQFKSCNYFPERNEVYFETCRRDMSRKKVLSVCKNKAVGEWKHMIDQVLCCKECCNVEAEADRFIPFCGTLNSC